MRRLTCSTLLAAVLLAGCSAPAPLPAPASSADGAVPTASASGHRTPTVTPAIQPGADQLVNDDPTLPVNIAWPVLPDAPGVGRAIQDWATDRVTRFLAEETPSTQAPPELHGTFERLGSVGGYAGVRTTLDEFGGASHALTTRTYYGDAEGRVWIGGDLISPDRRDALISQVLAALSAAGHEPDDSAVQEDDVKTALLDDLSFAPDGSLVVRVSGGLVTAYGIGPQTVKLPKASVEGLLTAEGRQIADAFASVATAAPSPEPSAPQSTPAPDASAAAPTASTPAPTASSPTATSTSGGVDCAVAQCVALTFDDGPGPYTGSILDTLTAAGVKATFFEIGQNADAYPAIVRRQAELGMVIGSHTYDHPQLTKLTAAQQEAQVAKGEAAVASAGVPKPTLLRPPYGSLNSATRGLGRPLVLWDVDSEDWKNRNVTATTDLIMKEVKRGSIVLMHDIQPSTARALPGIIAKLKARGYTLVTVPELVGSPQGGRVYHNQRG